MWALVWQSAIFLPMTWMQTKVNVSCLCALNVYAKHQNLTFFFLKLLLKVLHWREAVQDFSLICCSWVVPSGSLFHPCLCPTWMIWMSWSPTSDSCSTSLQGWPPSSWSSWLWVRRTGSQGGDGWSVHSLWCCKKSGGLFLHRLLCLSFQYFRTNQPPLPLRRRPNTSCLRGFHTLLLWCGCCGTGPSCSWCSATVGSFQSPSTAPAAEQFMTMLLLEDSPVDSCWL